MRIHIADDHDILVEGVKSLLNQHGFEIVGASTDGREVIKWFQNHTADVLILDISMKNLNGLEVLKYFKNNSIAQKTIILSSYDNYLFINDALLNNAKGFVLKDEAHSCLVEAVRKVFNGGDYFSPKIYEIMLEHQLDESLLNINDCNLSDRELDIITLLKNEYSSVDIAKRINAPTSTIRTQTKRLRDKMRVKTNIGLIFTAMYYEIIK